MRSAVLTKSRHVLAVQNLKQSAQFYEEALGFRTIAEFDGWRFLQRDAVVLMLGECPHEQAASATGDHAYFAYIESNDCQTLFQACSDKGIPVIKPLTDEPWGMREFGIQTPDGHRILFGEEMRAD